MFILNNMLIYSYILKYEAPNFSYKHIDIALRLFTLRLHMSYANLANLFDIYIKANITNIHVLTYNI